MLLNDQVFLAFNAANRVQTKLLLNFESDFSDESEFNFTPTVVGTNPWTITGTDPKFGVGAGDHQFNTVDRIEYGTAADWQFLNSKTAYTIAGWIKPIVQNANGFPRQDVFLQTGGNDDTDVGLTLSRQEGGSPRFFAQIRNGVTPFGIAGTSPPIFPLNSWVFFTFSYDGNETVWMSINGDVREISGTSVADAFSGLLPTNTLSIGGPHVESENKIESPNGLLDSLIIQTGIVRYTENFIPPDQPFTVEAIPEPTLVGGDSLFASVDLLMDFEGGEGGSTFTDLGPQSRTITNNGAATTLTDKQFGASSGLFVYASSQSLVLPGTANSLKHLHDGTTSWTIEGWVNPVNLSFGVNSYLGTDAATANVGFVIAITNTGAVRFIVSKGTPGSYAIDVTTVATIPTGSWSYLSVEFDGSNYYIGVGPAGGTVVVESFPVGTGYSSADASSDLYIGAVGPGTLYYDGKLDSLRMTRAARGLTSNYLAPTSDFPKS